MMPGFWFDTEMGKIWGRHILVGNGQKFSFGHVNFEMPVRHPSGASIGSWKYWTGVQGSVLDETGIW